MLKWLIKQLQKMDKETYNPDKDLPDPNQERKKIKPHVAITGFEINPDNPTEGAFAFDWNDEFIRDLRRLGYEGKKEEDLVDQWFADICKNVVMETWEQENARIDNLPDNPNLISKRKLDDDRSEYF
jgi:hypothetical protein